jgi:hypothetical protein
MEKQEEDGGGGGGGDSLIPCSYFTRVLYYVLVPSNRRNPAGWPRAAELSIL